MKRLLALALALALLLCACSPIGPRGRTLALHEPAPSESPSAGQESSGGFLFKKRYAVALEKLNPEGQRPDTAEKRQIVGWLDDDSLLAVAYFTGESGGMTAELGKLSYQFGFYEGLLPLGDKAPEFVSLSRGREMLACQMEAEGVGKYLVIYSLGEKREIFSVSSFRVRSLPVWAADDHALGVAAYASGKYTPSSIDIKSGAVGKVGPEQSRALSILDFPAEGGLLLRREAGEEGVYSLEFQKNGGEGSPLYSGYVGGATALSGDTALLLARDSLRLLAPGADGVTAESTIESAVAAYAFSGDRHSIALAQRNRDGSIDIYAGLFSSGKVVNKVLVYKNIEGAGLGSVSRLLFSPDSKKLYVEGNSTAGLLQAVVLEFA
ncbi:MAG: hypothetical protein LBU47_00270 [Christensenellaceae bacterium]|jgi:hypothetical protein|nr:hypothetical protein [Christensenellaceae bacterium]